MKVYLKIHKNQLAGDIIETVACCDDHLLNRCFKEGNLKIEISNHFYGGKLINIDEAIAILSQASHFNIVGENITNKAIDTNILPKEGVRRINGIPMAIRMIF